MKEIDRFNDALGDLDEKFVEEYIEGAPRKRIPWKPIAVSAACLAVIVSAVCVPFALRRVPDKGDKSDTDSSVYTGMAGLEPHSETIVDKTGREVLHVTNAGAPEGTLISQNYALDWHATAYCYMTHDTPTLLAIKGVKVSSDSYSYRYESDEGTVYERICYVSGIRITEMLKENNSSAYAEGDIIYVFVSLTGQLNEDGGMTYFYYGESCIPPEEESVYLLATNEEKRHIPAWVKDMGLIEADVWDTTGVTSVEKFEEILRGIEENREYYEDNF